MYTNQRKRMRAATSKNPTTCTLPSDVISHTWSGYTSQV